MPTSRSCNARRRLSTRIIRNPAHSGSAASTIAGTRSAARRARIGRPVSAPTTRMASSRSPGVCPVVDQKNTKYANDQATASTAPIAASAVTTPSGTSTSDSPSATTSAMNHATALMTAASAANASVRVARPAYGFTSRRSSTARGLG